MRAKYEIFGLVGKKPKERKFKGAEMRGREKLTRIRHLLV